MKRKVTQSCQLAEPNLPVPFSALSRAPPPGSILPTCDLAPARGPAGQGHASLKPLSLVPDLDTGAKIGPVTMLTAKQMKAWPLQP